MAGFGSSTGFTLLVWINPDTWRLEGLDVEQRVDKTREMLQDVITLYGGRWGMEGTLVEDGGDLYAFFVCSRFVVSQATLLRALGTLSEAVKMHRGGPTDNHRLLIEYRKCLLKYDVQDKVTEDYSGEGYAASQSGQSWGTQAKRARKQ